jgi:hypothetical protein
MEIKDEAALRHMVKEHLDDGRRCELRAEGGGGQCPHPAVGVRLESGFSDLVCEYHTGTAEQRGVQVLRP